MSGRNGYNHNGSVKQRNDTNISLSHSTNLRTSSFSAARMRLSGSGKRGKEADAEPMMDLLVKLASDIPEDQLR